MSINIPNVVMERLDSILDNLSVLEKKQDKLESCLVDINLELTNIKEVLTRLDKNCSRMDDHINFVEETYDTLKFPITVLKNKVEQVFGKQKEIKE